MIGFLTRMTATAGGAAVGSYLGTSMANSRQAGWCPDPTKSPYHQVYDLVSYGHYYHLGVEWVAGRCHSLGLTPFYQHLMAHGYIALHIRQLNGELSDEQVQAIIAQRQLPDGEAASTETPDESTR